MTFPESIEDLQKWCESFAAGAAYRQELAQRRGKFDRAREWSATKRTLRLVAKYMSNLTGDDLTMAVADPRVCWLCGDFIPTHSTAPSHLIRTSDHVVPASLGGSNGKRNLRPAHRRCNNRRANDNGKGWFNAHPTAKGAIRAGYSLPPPSWPQRESA